MFRPLTVQRERQGGTGQRGRVRQHPRWNVGGAERALTVDLGAPAVGRGYTFGDERGDDPVAVPSRGEQVGPKVDVVAVEGVLHAGRDVGQSQRVQIS